MYGHGARPGRSCLAAHFAELRRSFEVGLPKTFALAWSCCPGRWPASPWIVSPSWRGTAARCRPPRRCETHGMAADKLGA